MKSKDKTGANMPERKKKEGVIPNTFEQQNLGHNSKKEPMGPNTKR